MINLTAAGLSPTETKCYETLLTQTAWKPSQLAKAVNQTRTNCYKILDNLVGKGLASRVDDAKVLHYRAANPSRLFDLALAERAEAEIKQKELELSAQQLMSQYIKTHEQPGIRFYQGKANITLMLESQVKPGQSIHFINSLAGISYFSYEEMSRIRRLAVEAGIPRFALTPDNEFVPKKYLEHDEANLLTRTWMKQSDYNAPVEWGVADDTLYIISYGKDALGLTIQSTQIADAFKQIFKLIERGQKSQDWYSTLPRLNQKD